MNGVLSTTDGRSGTEEPLLEVRDLVVDFPTRRGVVRAVSGVSFSVVRGETLGLVGESGCGKSTTGRSVMHLPAPTSGQVRFEGVDFGSLTEAELRTARTRLQLIFQDPIASLNPHRRVRDIVAEPLRIWNRTSDTERRAVVDRTLEAVGLDPDTAGGKRPREFSGGQCQRISIARSLVLNPSLLICDEPVSALDVSVQAQILNLLEDMKSQFDLSMLFIAHDLAVVNRICDRVAVMSLGRFCEVASTEALFSQPAHPYTEALLRSIPVPDPTVAPERRGLLEGDLPSPLNPPSGCRFRTRCPRAEQRCADEMPELRMISPGREVACHFPNP